MPYTYYAVYGNVTGSATSVGVLANDAFAGKIRVTMDIEVERIMAYMQTNNYYTFKFCIWDSYGSVVTNSVAAITSGYATRWEVKVYSPRPVLYAGNDYYIGFISNTAGGLSGKKGSGTSITYTYDNDNSYSSPNSFEPSSETGQPCILIQGIPINSGEYTFGLVSSPYFNYAVQASSLNTSLVHNRIVTSTLAPSGCYCKSISVDIRKVNSGDADGEVKFVIWNASKQIVTNSVSPAYTVSSAAMTTITHTYDTRPYLPASTYYPGCIIKPGAGATNLWLATCESSYFGSGYSTGSNNFTTPVALDILYNTNKSLVCNIVCSDSETDGYGNKVYTIPSEDIGSVYTVESADISKVFGV